MPSNRDIDILYQIVEACTLKHVIGANGEKPQWEILPGGDARFTLPELPSEASARTIFERESHMKALSKAFGLMGKLDDWESGTETSVLTVPAAQLKDLNSTLVKARFLDINRDRTSDSVGWQI